MEVMRTTLASENMKMQIDRWLYSTCQATALGSNGDSWVPRGVRGSGRGVKGSEICDPHPDP